MLKRGTQVLYKKIVELGYALIFLKFSLFFSPNFSPNFPIFFPRGTQVLYKKIVELGYALELTSSTDTLDTAQYLQEVGQCARARTHTHTHTRTHTHTEHVHAHSVGWYVQRSADTLNPLQDV